MNLDLLKDEIFELLNESSSLDMEDIDLDDVNNIIKITAADGSVYEIECRQIK